MFDQGHRESCLSWVFRSSENKGCADTCPTPVSYDQPVRKRNTVKELIMMKRLGSRTLQFQEAALGEKPSKRSQTNMLEFDFELVKPDLAAETFAIEPSTNVFNTPMLPSNEHNFLHTCDIGYSTQQPIQQVATQQDMAVRAPCQMNLFQWHINKKISKLNDIAPEMLYRQDEDGDTYLHIAVAHGKRALAYAIASKMASAGWLDVQENKGQTALHVAAATNQHLIVQDLLLHGAQITVKDCWGRCPLHVCAEKGYLLTLQNVQKTLSKRENCQQMNVDLYNHDGLTPLHVAVLSHNAVLKEIRHHTRPYPHKELIQRKHMLQECIMTLLLMGARLGSEDGKSGRTSLHMASEEANVELIYLFLRQQSALSFVNAKTYSGNTALHIASSLQNHIDQVNAVKLLVRGGADPSVRNRENELPSQLAPDGTTGNKVRQILKGKDIPMLN